MMRGWGGRWALAVATLTVAAGLTACGDTDDLLRTPEGSVITTVTTRIARVDIVNPGRDFEATCLAPTADDDGSTDAPRTIVTDPQLLDAFCALGIPAAVRGVTAPAGSIPAYLGPALAAVPTFGDEPTAQQVADANAQVVLATPATEADVNALRQTGALGSARVVTVDPGTGADWKATFTSIAAALNRSAAAATRVAEFDAEAARIGRVTDASHTQVSLVRFTPDAELIEGTDNFGAAVLAEAGAQRPVPQRVAGAAVVTDVNFAAVEGDIIYVSADGEQGLSRGTSMLESDRWQELGAPSWSRVRWVDDEIWYRSAGLAAAWLILHDIRSSLNSTSAG